MFITHSADDGETWADPVEITADVKKPSWNWYATGPGVGIQLQRGEHRGRLVIPCDHREDETYGNGSHTIYSDDHGADVAIERVDYAGCEMSVRLWNWRMGR